MPSAVSAGYGRDCRSRSPKAAPGWTWPGPAQDPACFLRPCRSAVLSRPRTVPGTSRRRDWNDRRVSTRRVSRKTGQGIADGRDARGAAESREADRSRADGSSAAPRYADESQTTLDPGQRQSRRGTARCFGSVAAEHPASRRRQKSVHERRRRLLQPQPRLLGRNRVRHDGIHVSPAITATSNAMSSSGSPGRR